MQLGIDIPHRMQFLAIRLQKVIAEGQCNSS